MGAGHSFPIVQLSKEKIVIVTGANSGLGYEIAKWTAMMGATVIMACRSEEKTTDAIHRMNAEFVAEKKKGTQGLTDSDKLELKFMKLDLASFKSVLQFVENFQKTYSQLHVLFCNAGLGLGPYVKTEDGLEMLLQVNYLSHFILTAKLLPTMKQSGPDCRILLMSSIAHSVGRFEINTMNYSGAPRDYPIMQYYGRSKLYQIMQMYAMARRLQGSNITVNSLHPGLVNTEFGRDAEAWYFRHWLSFAKATDIAKSPEKAAKCSIDCVVNPQLDGVTGVYFVDFSRKKPSSQARNQNDQEALWTKTFEFIGQYLTDDEKSAMECQT